MSEAVPRIVLDTNVLLVSISSRSRYHWIFRALLNGRISLLISNEILSEYEEVIGGKLSPAVAQEVARTLLLLPNVELTHPTFRWHLIEADPDDDKFVDCLLAGNGQMLVTEDRHFGVLRDLGFPKIQVIGISELEKLVKEMP